MTAHSYDFLEVFLLLLILHYGLVLPKHVTYLISNKSKFGSYITLFLYHVTPYVYTVSQQDVRNEVSLC